MSYGNTHLMLSGGNDANALTAETIKTGRYAVIKLRSSGNREIAFDAQTGDNASHGKTVFAKNEELADQWMVWVIDLSACAVVDGNGYTCDSEQTVKFRITTGVAKQAGENEEGIAGGTYVEDPYYLDIAYFAIVDSVDEARGMIEDESFTLFSNGLNNEGTVTETAPSVDPE